MSRRGGPRRLTDAEITIWLAVAQTVAPRQGARLPVAPPLPQPPVVVPSPKPAGTPGTGGTRKGAASPGAPRAGVPFLPPYVPPVSAPKPGQPPLAPFEKRYRQKVTRGRVTIDGAIDLHGMTQPQAHGALSGFLRNSAAGGARLVLVVTGKGRGQMTAGGEAGVLRRAVPMWLRDAALRPIVMGFEEAGLTHGGFGALYVRLRRREG